MKKKLLSILLVAAMTLSFAACGGSAASNEGGSAAPAGDDGAAAPAASSDEVYNVAIQFTFPEESGDGVKQVMQAIEEESNGRIKFDVYWSFSFVDTGDVIDALQTNQLDIAGFMPNDYGIFPLNGRLASLPLYNYPTWKSACQIYTSMVYNNPEMLAEFTDNGLVFWGGYTTPGYQFFSNKEVASPTPEMFKGLTIMCDNAYMQTIIKDNQGGSNTVFPTEFLSNLQNGVADALVQHVNCAFVFGCFDYTKTAVMFGEGGLFDLSLDYAFSETFWNSLPSDLQDIFAAHAQELCQASYEADNGLYSNVALPALQEKANIIELDDAQIAAWQEAIAPVVDSAIADISKDSPNVATIYENWKNAVANYDEATFDIGTNNFGLDANWK